MFELIVEGRESLLHSLTRYRTQLRPAILHGVQSSANEAVIWARAHRLSGPRPHVLQVRTGRLRASFRAQVTERGARVTARVGFLAPEAPFWAWVHEEGPVTIRPRHRQALTIPLAGVEGRAADYPGLYRRGRVLYQGHGSEARPVFLLARQVTIPPRPVLAPTEDYLAPLLMQRLADLVSP